MHKQAILAFLIVCQIGQSWCLNPVARSIQHYPRSYNLHQEFTPQNINDLSDDMKKRAMFDVKATIMEVQRLLQQDPALPRLTRGEIQDIFENVTRDELVKSIKTGDKSREKHMRALMLVLPYHANDLSPENLEELYTKAPITKLMNGEPRRNVVHLPIPPSPLSQRERLATTYRPSHKFRNVMTTQYVRKMNPTTFHPKPNFVTTRNYPMPTTYTPTDNYRREKIKERYSSQYNADMMPNLPNLRRGPGKENIRDMLSAMGLAPGESMNYHMEPEPTSTPVNLMPWETEMNYVTAPPVTLQPLPSTNDIQDILKTLGLLQPPPKLQYQIRPSKLAAPLSLHHHDSQPRGVSPQFFGLPQVADFLEANTENKPVAVPLVQEKPEPEPEQPKTEIFKPLPLKTKEVKMSIAPKISPRDFVSFKKLPEETPKVVNEEFADFLKMYGLLGTPHRESKAVEEVSTTTTATTTTTTTPTTTTTTTTTTTPTTTTTEVEQTSSVSTTELPVVTEAQYLPEVYEAPQTTEQPLPITTKMVPLKGIPEISRELLTPAMAGVLDNMGFAPEKPQKLRRSQDSSRELETPRPSPVYQPPQPEQDFSKLQKLFVTIHELDKQNRNLTVADLESLNIEGFGDLLQPGPDPLSYNEYDVARNEVKRQSDAATTEATPTRVDLPLVAPASQTVEEEIVEEQIVTRQQTPIVAIVTPTAEVIETTTSPATTTTTTTAQTTTTTASNAARANSLADSFPKETAPVKEEPLPPPRRNGFYFYSDWNTFLEVGEDPNKVVIRFDPKIGDPSRFIEVNIPSKTT